MDNRERARELDYESFAKEIAQIPVELHGIRWSSKTRFTSIKHDHAAIVEVLRRVAGEARAAIEGAKFNSNPEWLKQQASLEDRFPFGSSTDTLESLLQEALVFVKANPDEYRLDLVRRAERVLEAAPRELDRCPKCGGDITREGGHGPWCRDEKCKWGWEIEPAAALLRPAAQPVSKGRLREALERIANSSPNWCEPQAVEKHSRECIAEAQRALESA